MSLANLLTGGLGTIAKEAFGLVKAYFPPSMSESDKQDVMLKLEALQIEKQKVIGDAANDAEKNLNQRIAEHEGTASDLKSIPIVGTLMIFLRGLQRPVWGFATLYMDFMVFSGAWVLSDDQIRTAFFTVNFLVLGFLFGERAMKNVLPLVAAFLRAKNGTGK